MLEPDHLASPDGQSYTIYMDQDVLLANMAGMVKKVNPRQDEVQRGGEREVRGDGTGQHGLY